MAPLIEDLIPQLRAIGPVLFTLLYAAAATGVTVDAVLHKRHVRSAIGWIGLAWMAPIFGAGLYLLFGINRIERCGSSLNLSDAWWRDFASAVSGSVTIAGTGVFDGHPGLAGMDRLASVITGRPLWAGNQVDLLPDGDTAFPEMLAAIDRAEESISLVTFIFDDDEVGRQFRDALVRATGRGVAVRVLVDGLGSRYSRTSMVAELKRRGVPAENFLPTFVLRLFRYANLRNHKKIMVVDGRIGFVGGTNIREGHWLSRNPRHPVRCLHFRVEGPVVADMQGAFASDWDFASGERLIGAPWFVPLAPRGTVYARGIPDGPDTDLDNMPTVMLGALSAARTRVRIISPYFLPDEPLYSAIRCAALRGVLVEIVIPERTNFKVMDWAMRYQLTSLLESGCRVYLSPPPFDHAKLFTVDGAWALIGSTNWDSRSLRLNFEYDLECYDEDLAARLDAVVDGRIQAARRIDLDELRKQSLASRLRSGAARLLTPYI